VLDPSRSEHRNGKDKIIFACRAPKVDRSARSLETVLM